MTDIPRRAFGADRLEPGGGGELVLVCPAPKSWTPRQPKTLTRSEHPGTAVDWDGGLFEVLQCDPVPGGGMRYRLAPWTDGHAIRRMERYDAASEEIREGDRRDRRNDDAKRWLVLLLAPLAGLLPGQVQKRLEHDLGTPAVWLTVASALPLFVAGFFGLVGVLVGMAGATLPMPGWLAPPAPIAAYLFGESALRLASAIGGGEPMGTLAAALGLALWQAARGAPTPPEPPPARTSEDTQARADDLFHVLEPVLALLAPAEQEILVGRFAFDPIRWGRITAAVLLAAAVLNTIVSFAALGQPGGLLGELLWSLPALYIAVEQVRRLRSLAAGRPAGSVLGRLVRRYARPLLAEETPAAPG